MRLLAGPIECRLRIAKLAFRQSAHRVRKLGEFRCHADVFREFFQLVPRVCKFATHLLQAFLCLRVERPAFLRAPAQQVRVLKFLF